MIDKLLTMTKSDFEKLDSEIYNFLLSNGELLPPKWQRHIAMYYPNAVIRKKYWELTNVVLGKDTYLPLNITVYDNFPQKEEPAVRIGTNCSIGPGIFASMFYHTNSKTLREEGILDQYEKYEPIIIGDDVYLAGFFTIAPGVKIGSNCIIGANSFINKDIPDYSLAFGNPIKVIKDLRDN